MRTGRDRKMSAAHVLPIFHAEVDKARELLWAGVPDPVLEISDMGRTAGQCRHEGGLDFTIRINDQLAEYGEDTLIETIRHELAHWVTNVQRMDVGRPRRGVWSSHGPRWKFNAAKLGCQTDRCHMLDLTPTRRHRRFKYRLPSGQELYLKTTRHRRLRQGRVKAYRFKPTGERVLPHHFVREVAV